MTRPITFGVFIPQGWKMELASIDGAEAKWAKAVEIAELAESLGYDSLWVYDHFHPDTTRHADVAR
jgi:alkanesulfonate monooxygenase SsuD/methylene tetrahydromethanopterin reductase-like flavin-dependent oxidoreductase (luciferase family)